MTRPLNQRDIRPGLEFTFLGTCYEVENVRPRKRVAIVSNPSTDYRGEIPIANILRRGETDDPH